MEYSLFNPSIADYILEEHSQDTFKLINIYRSLYSVISLKKLCDLQKNNRITLEQLKFILETLFKHSFKGEHNYDYIIFLSHGFIGDKSKTSKIISFLKEVILHPKRIEEFSWFIELINQMNVEIADDYSFLIEMLRGKYLDFDELQILFSFIDKHQITDKELFSELETQLEGFLSDEIEDLRSDIDVSSYITSTEGHDGDYDIDVDESGIVQCLENGLNDSLLTFDSEIIEKLDLNIGSVIGDYVSVDDLLSDYFKSMEQEGYEYEKGSLNTLDKVSDIDDLFERT